MILLDPRIKQSKTALQAKKKVPKPHMQGFSQYCELVEDIYIYRYIYIYICLNMCIYICVDIHMCSHTCTQVCMCVYFYTHISEYMYVCVCVCCVGRVGGLAPN